MSKRRFPMTQNELIELARQVYEGLLAHPDAFPGIDPAPLSAKLAGVATARENQSLAEGALRVATAAKAAATEELATATRRALRQAEAVCLTSPAELARLGWRERRQGGTLEKPIAPYNLTARREEAGQVTLTWTKASGGGPVRTWLIQRRIMGPEGPGPWDLLEMSYDNLVILQEEPAGRREYRVRASNTAGQSPPSNTAVV